MRKVLLLLLFVLPFQFAWAAAGAACLHQSEPTSHFGHHAKVAKQANSDPRDGGSLPSDADDCPTCGSHSLKIAAQIATLPEVATVAAGFAHVAPVLSSHPPDRPERPNWRVPD
ncbi:MAG: hypothetical protein U1F58_07685 [Burkholderiales bacterium]